LIGELTAAGVEVDETIENMELAGLRLGS